MVDVFYLNFFLFWLTIVLKKYIKGYFIVEINQPEDFLPKERVLPNGCISMVFHYGLPSKFKKKNSSEYIEPSLVICGQQTSHYDLLLAGNTGMIVILFKPFGVKPFFNFPITELKDENLSLQDLIKIEASELEDKLYNSKDTKQRIAYIENFFFRKLFLDKDFERVEHAVKIIEKANGQVKIELVAQEVCLGIKQFERVFSKHIGLNPKKFTNIIRFQNVIQMKRKCNDANLYQLAFDNGYYDQSHFIHDFKNFSGLAPKDFFNSKE